MTQYNSLPGRSRVTLQTQRQWWMETDEAGSDSFLFKSPEQRRRSFSLASCFLLFFTLSDRHDRASTQWTHPMSSAACWHATFTTKCPTGAGGAASQRIINYNKVDKTRWRTVQYKETKMTRTGYIWDLLCVLVESAPLSVCASAVGHPVLKPHQEK